MQSVDKVGYSIVLSKIYILVDQKKVATIGTLVWPASLIIGYLLTADTGSQKPYNPDLE